MKLIVSNANFVLSSHLTNYRSLAISHLTESPPVQLLKFRILYTLSTYLRVLINHNLAAHRKEAPSGRYLGVRTIFWINSENPFGESKISGTKNEFLAASQPIL